MAKKMYIGVDNVAKQVKKGYIGVEDKARKIKSGYYGVDGIARQFFSGEKKVVYYGEITSLSNTVEQSAATHTLDYALFAGGFSSAGGVKSNVDAYNSQLVKSVAPALITSVYMMGATNLQDRAIFYGGSTGTLTGASTTGYIYTNDLVQTSFNHTGINSQGYDGAYLPNYAVFSANYMAMSNPAKYCLCVDNNGVCTQISTSFENTAGTIVSVGKYVVIGGGTYTTKGNALDNNLVLTTVTDFSNVRYHAFGASILDKYGLVCGSKTGTYLPIEGYDSNLSKCVLSREVSSEYGTATSFDEFAIFVAGKYATSSYNTTAYIYDENLTEIDLATQIYRYTLSSTQINNFALFGGGRRGDTYYSNVYAIQLI